MGEIEKIIIDIQDKFIVKFVGSVHSYDEGGDIDFFMKLNQREKITDYLKARGFVMRDVREHGVSGCKFIGGSLYVLDFTDDSSVILRLFPDVKLTEKFYIDIWKDEKIEKFLRYSLQFRSYKDKYIYFVKKNFDTYGKYLSNKIYFSKQIYRKNLKVDNVIGSMNKNLRDLFISFSFVRLVKIFFVIVSIHFKNIGKGEVVAFVGADGSGKTTAIDKTWQIMGVHKKYMGDVNYKFQGFYNWLLRKPLLLSRSVYFFMYIENWFRYLWIWLRKIKGDTVYTDRWPGLNQHLKSNNSKKKILHDFVYIFFPKADRYVFLSGKPEIIHVRKPELSIEEIDTLQKNMRIKLKGREYIEVQSENLDLTLTEVLKYLLKSEKN